LLRNRRESRSLLGSRNVVVNRRLLRKSRLSRGGRQRGSGLRRGRLLGRLSACLWLLSLLIYIEAIGLTIQTHATELYCSSVDCVVAGHDNSLLLLEHSTLVA